MEVKSDPARPGVWQVAQEMFAGLPAAARAYCTGRRRVSTRVTAPEKRGSKYSFFPSAWAPAFPAHLLEGSGGGVSGSPDRLVNRVHSAAVNSHPGVSQKTPSSAPHPTSGAAAPRAMTAITLRPSPDMFL